ncbi:MAG: TraX family protein [Oscillospiraceae bacterium]
MKPILNGNALKIVAMISMFIDHFGMIFFPEVTMFRIVGRIAFPIYAFLVAEGCKYTHDRKRYFLRMFILGIVCSVVFIVAEGYIYLCVLITFSISILLIYLLDYVKINLKMRFPLFIFGLLISFIVCHLVEVDYGFFGVLVPVMVYLSDDRPLKIILFAVSLIFLTISIHNDIQVYCLTSLIFVALYDGTRGKLNLKMFFYLFYPLHIVLLWSVATLLNFAI